MYVNEICLNGKAVSTFVTDERCFTVDNPIYKKVQETLELLGFKATDNHIFVKDETTIHFFHRHEIRLYVPVHSDISTVNMNRLAISSHPYERTLIRHLEYIFFYVLKSEEVERILKRE